ncbi:MAG: VOC family protein [Anaerolineae bacterium]|nr:VOC family protein [Anaerolineae bacterium]
MDAEDPLHGLRLGPVHLMVADLERQVHFYETVIGLRLRDRAGDTAFLGAGGPDLLILTGGAAAPRPRRATGLYHFAILVPDRQALARTLLHLEQVGAPLHGFADHDVSEAIYLPDAEGNGIEIYCDRPRSAWQYPGGKLQMGTALLDVEGLLRLAREQSVAWDGLPERTTVGHLHLHVADLLATEAFYRDVLGFEVTARLPGAVFLAADGYHHHVGVNTWNGPGAPPPPPGAPGLRWFTLRLPDAPTLAKVRARLDAAGIPQAAQDGGWLACDPSGNGLLLTVA